jgi:hypothetical protein
MPYIPTSRDSSPSRSGETAYVPAVCIPDYYMDAPQAWFRSINATFAVNKVTNSLTRFYWVLSKLTATLMDTIGLLADDPKSVADPYEELQNTVLRSYRLSAHQSTVKWLDHRNFGSNKPSVLMDQLNFLKPSSVDKIQKVLFLRKMTT